MHPADELVTPHRPETIPELKVRTDKELQVVLLASHEPRIRRDWTEDEWEQEMEERRKRIMDSCRKAYEEIDAHQSEQQLGLDAQENENDHTENEDSSLRSRQSWL